MKYESSPEKQTEYKQFKCRYCGKIFESELGGMCPHCHRFQTNSMNPELPKPIDEEQDSEKIT